MCDELFWKVKTSRSSGDNYFETATATVDPWSLVAVKMLALRLGDEWRPVTAACAEATGAGAGWATLTRIVSAVGSERSERYTLVGSAAFLNAEGNIALYVELLSGKVEQRTSAEDALGHVLAQPMGLRWLGSIVPSGAGLKARITAIEREIASRYRLVPDTGWVQVPFYTRGGQLRMSETKVKAALGAEPVAHRPRAGKVCLQIKARTGQWRSIQARPVEVGAAGMLLVGPHGFVTAERDGYIYLTATGAVEPTYRLPLAEYNKLKGTNHVEKAVRRQKA